MNALCYASGQIVFSRGRVKPGALPIASGRAAKLYQVVTALARHGYYGNTLLVPGLPEAANWDERIGSVMRFKAEVEKRLGNPKLARRIEKYEARVALKRRLR